MTTVRAMPLAYWRHGARLHCAGKATPKFALAGRSLLFAACALLQSACFVVSTSAATPETQGAAAPVPAAEPIRIPRDASRFEIDAVDDSTARFKVWEADWVRPGLVAHIVDPLQRDALVAGVRVIAVSNGTAVALVTSQVTRVRTEYIVLVSPPATPWWKQQRFWLGAAIGAAVGSVLGANHVF